MSAQARSIEARSAAAAATRPARGLTAAEVIYGCNDDTPLITVCAGAPVREALERASVLLMGVTGTIDAFCDHNIMRDDEPKINTATLYAFIYQLDIIKALVDSAIPGTLELKGD